MKNRYLELAAALQMLWKEHGTKLLGGLATFVASVVTAALSVPDLIPPEHLKWWAFANAVLGTATIRRGWTNTARTKQP